MCHRQLRFVKSTECGHLTRTSETNVDCGSLQCFLSVAHPSNCGSPMIPCSCRRYYGQPERIVTQQVPGKCRQCPQ
ncbi:hypothetical protein BDQ17DRAFT_1353522 [Cyathus striatus]|nr:hypothetical protein BDQ17DRAFT_1353522 [Cyathus striatus]